MAHSLIPPIVVGYVFAHYLSYLVEKGQQAVIALFGLHDVEVAYVLSAHPAVLATLKVCFVVAGHIGGGDCRARRRYPSVAEKGIRSPAS